MPKVSLHFLMFALGDMHIYIFVSRAHVRALNIRLCTNDTSMTCVIRLGEVINMSIPDRSRRVA
jgi:hypothetical protein